MQLGIYYPLADVATHAQCILRNMLAEDSPVLKDLDGRQGGYVCVAGNDGIPLMIAKVGVPSNEKISKYIELCQEKVRRLADNPGHMRSYQSRNPDQGQ